VIGGEDAFRLHDTFGFPLDLTEVMARERGCSVDVEGFEKALERQRARSRGKLRGSVKSGEPTVSGNLSTTLPWQQLTEDAEQVFVGYDRRGVSTEVIAARGGDAEWSVQLRENPFYVEAGGQISDQGAVTGDGWQLTVERVERVEGRTALAGPLEGDAPPLDAGPIPVRAQVPEDVRHDTERNHTATHLLHAALRSVLGEHATQQGSLVAPDRLRFDFAHSGPMAPAEIEQVETFVNEAVWHDHPVKAGESTYDEAIAAGAMALFGEKYGDRVRTITIPGVSIELCGGTHLRHTGEVGLFKVVSEAGVAAGVRRIEAVTGPGALKHYQDIEAELEQVSGLLRTPVRNVVGRTRQLIAEKKELERLLDEMSKAGSGRETVVVASELTLGDGDPFRAAYRAVRLRARRADEVRGYGDDFLAAEPGGVAVVAAELPGGKQTLFSFVGAALIRRGIKADDVVRGVAAVVGGRGGGRPHMAQAGVADPSRLDEALAAGEAVVRELSAGGRGDTR
jgi:alanyl-tRNA synthetase